MAVKIGIVGAGAVGCYYGARLARVGENVHFLMRRDLETVRRRGLHVRLPDDDFVLPQVQTAATPEELGPCDLVIVALKSTANHELARLIPPLLHEQSAILTLQNGLGSDELLASEFGAQRVLGGLCFICVNRLAPGEIDCTQPGTLSLAEFGRPASERVRTLAAMFSRAGVRTTVGDDLAELRWRKLVWNVPFNGLAIAAGGITTDRILADPGLAAEARALMQEVVGAAAKLGYVISPKFIEAQIEHTRPMGSYRPSSLIDYQEGRAVEVESIWGEAVRRAQQAGAAVPRMQGLYETLLRLTAAQQGN